MLVAVALSLTTAGAQAANASAGSGASSVADMQWRKHDAELRAQLVDQGRWKEIRKMDEVTAQRLQVQHDQHYVQVNGQLAHRTGPDGQPIDARALDCDPDTMHVR